VSVYPDNKIN